MKITINGEEKEISGTMNVVELLKSQDVEQPEMVSVELNGTILRRENFEATLVNENDTLEFIYFMGGGQ